MPAKAPGLASKASNRQLLERERVETRRDDDHVLFAVRRHVGHRRGVAFRVEPSFPEHLPAMNTSPPAVTIGPPWPNAPVFFKPFASSSSLVPSVTFQAMSPVLALTAMRCAQGGG